MRWPADGGMHPLGDLEGGDFVSAARATNHDGSVVVGFGTSAASWSSAFGFEAMRWTADGGMEALGDLPGGFYDSFATAVSDDGSIVVGVGWAAGQEAFIWTEAGKMRNLKEWLASEHGLLLPGWMLTGATGISGDGTVIVGSGRNPQGQTEAWIVTVPEPTTAMSFGLAAALCLTRRRRPQPNGE